jgi:hypothetical protein
MIHTRHSYSMVSKDDAYDDDDDDDDDTEVDNDSY